MKTSKLKAVIRASRVDVELERIGFVFQRDAWVKLVPIGMQCIQLQEFRYAKPHEAVFTFNAGLQVSAVWGAYSRSGEPGTGQLEWCFPRWRAKELRHLGSSGPDMWWRVGAGDDMEHVGLTVRECVLGSMVPLMDGLRHVVDVKDYVDANLDAKREFPFDAISRAILYAVLEDKCGADRVLIGLEGNKVLGKEWRSRITEVRHRLGI